MKKILITGAAGFIGSHLVEYLLKDGESVDRLRLVLSKNGSTKYLPKENFDIVRGDIRNKDFVKKAMENVETVYHLAAIISLDKGTYKTYKEINVDGTSNLLEACAKKKIQKFVFLSSVAVYGLPPFRGDIINWDESHPKTYSDSEIYGRSKFEAEEKVIEAHKKMGIPYAIVRPSTVYGPRHFGMIYTLCKVLKNHQFFMIGNGKNKMHYVYITDFVKAIREIQLSPIENGDYIIASEKPTEFRNIVKYVAESINEKPPKLRIPKIIALIASYILDTCGKIIGVKSPLFPDRVKVMTANYYYNISKAKKEIGYNPSVTFQKGAMKTVKWYLKNDYLSKDKK